uniref:Uncharacterized protein n=1 Tax=Chrysotila carterae TaxID=13221 RepID=A0A7S4B5H9_CHRCT|eukprot:6200292-Pleurochrysis_carterae.AAC.3
MASAEDKSAGQPKAPMGKAAELQAEENMANSSPLGSALLQRKMERQNDPNLSGPVRPRPGGVSLEAERPPSPGADSPNLRARLKVLGQGEDPTKDSSPQGAQLMARKARRQQETQDGEVRRPKQIEEPAVEGALPPRPKIGAR